MAEHSCGPPENQHWISSNPLTVRMVDVLFIKKRGDGGIEVTIRGASHPCNSAGQERCQRVS